MALNKSILASLYAQQFPHLQPTAPVAGDVPQTAPPPIDSALQGAPVNDQQIVNQPSAPPVNYTPSDFNQWNPFAGVPAVSSQPAAAPPTANPPAVMTAPMADLDANYREKSAKLLADSNAPAQKQKAWKNALFLALQTANKFFNPQDQTPIQWLGEAKKQNLLNKDSQQLAPLIALRNQRMAEEEAKMKARVGAANLAKTEVETKAIENKPALDKAAELEKSNREQLNTEQKNIFDTWKSLPEYKPDDPKYKALKESAEKHNVVLVPKERDGDYSLQITPDGRAITFNKQTGKSTVGEDNYSKPTPISANALPDEYFYDIGLKSEKDISDAAAAQVGKLPDDRRIRPNIAASLPADYKNEDGTVNESKLLEGISSKTRDLRGLSLSEVYENLPSNYEQNLAGARNKMRGGNQQIAQKVAEFRTNITNYKPNSNAQEQPLNKVGDLFKAIMKQPPKIRDAKLKVFYENLPNIRIK